MCMEIVKGMAKRKNNNGLASACEKRDLIDIARKGIISKRAICRYFCDNGIWGLNCQAYEWRNRMVIGSGKNIDLDNNIQKNSDFGMVVQFLTYDLN